VMAAALLKPSDVATDLNCSIRTVRDHVKEFWQPESVTAPN
jgi:hypothetical protein